jgi:hypothetical protein
MKTYISKNFDRKITAETLRQDAINSVVASKAFRSKNEQRRSETAKLRTETLIEKNPKLITLITKNQFSKKSAIAIGKKHLDVSPSSSGLKNPASQNIRMYNAHAKNIGKEGYDIFGFKLGSNYSSILHGLVFEQWTMRTVASFCGTEQYILIAYLENLGYAITKNADQSFSVLTADGYRLAD